MSVASVSPAPRHLCDVAFRSAPPESPAPPSAAPPDHGAWTAEDVLGALARGAGVIETRAGLRLCHAHRRPELAKALPFFSTDVRMWLELGLTRRPLETALRGWPHRMRLYVAWLDEVLLPSGRDIEIRPGERVVNRDAFRASIQGRLWAGPTSPTAAPLLADLSALFRRYADTRRLEAPPARRFLRAA
ncbi:MAG: hypothetical protein AAF170_14695 [Bacteroidota bacterium]